MKNLLGVIACACALIVISCKQAPVENPNLTLIKQLDDLGNSGNSAGQLALFADNAVIRLMPPPPDGGMFEGKEGVAKFFEMVSPNFHVDATNYHAEGNKVTWDFEVRSDFFKNMGLDLAKGNAMAIVENGKIKEFVPTMSNETQGKMMFHQFVEQVINQKNLGAIDNLLAESFVEHEKLPPGIPPGRDGVKAIFSMMHVAFPDLKAYVHHMTAEGDVLTCFMTWTGTHQGDFMGMPATNNPVSFNVSDIVRFHDGKAVEHWGVMDIAGLMEQIKPMKPKAGEKKS